MARLNEPPVSTDSIETLRKKFLRQNRDIARVNSAQSLRIRSLETECGRLLSDNLTLNGRILELERELEESKAAQRIADHALEIKTKMETQLMEWGEMLQGLGIEPAAKRHASMSPGGRLTTHRRSVGRSPAAKRRPRDSRSSEAGAVQDGRLPPIQENKTYPRRTMSHDEILAICTEAADTNDSPDLGPPPTSRYVEEDPVKIDSPSRSTGTLEPSPRIQGETLPAIEVPAQPVLEPTKKTIATLKATPADILNTDKYTDASARPLLKAGSKRKFGDENDDLQVSRAIAGQKKANEKPALEKVVAMRDAKSRRGVKDPSSNKIGENDTETSSLRGRKPLADKSTNNDLFSPKKIGKAATAGDPVKMVLASDKETSAKTAPLKKKRVVPIKLPIPSLPAPNIAPIPQEPETPSADPGLFSPSTPETKSSHENPGDTPPPADISVHGETSRPSRRARPAISYAEPNLRAKMRRPTKELLDAVSGEGKYKRTSLAHIPATSSSSKDKVEVEATGSDSAQVPDAEMAMANEAARRPVFTSPLQEKDPPKEMSRDGLPDSVVTERRRRPFSRQSQFLDQQPDDHTEDTPPDVDPYEFQSTSPTSEQKKEPTCKGRVTKGVKRSATSNSTGGNDATTTAGHNNRPSRKRASMVAPKKSSMLDSTLDEDSSFDSSGLTASLEPASNTNDRISRRRSTML